MKKTSQKLVLITIESYHEILSKYKDSFSKLQVGKINKKFCSELGLTYINFSRIIGQHEPDYYIFQINDEKKLFLSKIKYPELKYQIDNSNSITIDNSIDKNTSLHKSEFVGRLDNGGRFYCNDGFNISIKWGVYYYCYPRNDIGPWSSFEAGFPSGRPSDLLMTYAEDKFMPINTIYCHVPEWVLYKEFELHGGLKHSRNFS